jgi:hypothetical protein
MSSNLYLIGEGYRGNDIDLAMQFADLIADAIEGTGWESSFVDQCVAWELDIPSTFEEMVTAADDFRRELFTRNVQDIFGGHVPPEYQTLLDHSDYHEVLDRLNGQH